MRLKNLVLFVMQLMCMYCPEAPIYGGVLLSQVWLAHCKPLQTTVAVKLVDLEELHTGLETLIKEAHTMMGLRHPNVLHLHCSFIAGETLWLVMPYITGGTISNLLRTQVWFPAQLAIMMLPGKMKICSRIDINEYSSAKCRGGAIACAVHKWNG